MIKRFCDLCGKNITGEEYASFDMPFPLSSIDLDDDLHVIELGVSLKDIPLDLCVSCLDKIWKGQNDKPFDIHKLLFK